MTRRSLAAAMAHEHGREELPPAWGPEELPRTCGWDSGQEELTCIIRNEQWLCFAGAALKRPHIQGKRNPSKTVGTERGDQRADRLKLQSQTTSQSDHMNYSFV